MLEYLGVDGVGIGQLALLDIIALLRVRALSETAERVHFQDDLLRDTPYRLGTIRLNLIPKSVDVRHKRRGCRSSEERETLDDESGCTLPRGGNRGAQTGAPAADHDHVVYALHGNVSGRFMPRCHCAASFGVIRVCPGPATCSHRPWNPAIQGIAAPD